MEFLIEAYDGKESGAKDRRIAARQVHLDGGREGDVLK